MPSKRESEQLSRDWQNQIAAWEQSGQSQKAFCNQHQLNYHRFGYWRRKFIAQNRVEVQPGNGFVPVERLPGNIASGLSLTLPSGLLIQGIDQSNLGIVRRLLEQL